MWTYQRREYGGVWWQQAEGFACLAAPALSSDGWIAYVIREDTGATVMTSRAVSEDAAKMDCDSWLSAWRVAQERDAQPTRAQFPRRP